MGQCKFNTAWVGMCKNEAIQGTEYCEEHSKVKCSICGEQATHDCDLTDMLVCGSPLCDSAQCHLQHLKRSHGSYFSNIEFYENSLNIPHSKYVIARAIYNPEHFQGVCSLNDKLKEQYEVLRVDYLNADEIMLTKCSKPIIAKTLDEMLRFLRRFHSKVESKFYSCDDILNLSEATPKSIIDTFVPVDLKVNENTDGDN